MHRATPLAQDESRSARSILPVGDRPTLVVIRCNPRTPHGPSRGGASGAPVPALVLLGGSPAPATSGPAQPARVRGSAPRRSEALQQFALAAERRRNSMNRFSAVAERMAGQASRLAETLRTLQCAESAG